jgi:hypothetical protein
MKWRSLEESDPDLDIRPLREIYAGRKELIAKYVPGFDVRRACRLSLKGQGGKCQGSI